VIYLLIIDSQLIMLEA